MEKMRKNKHRKKYMKKDCRRMLLGIEENNYLKGVSIF